MKRFKMYFDKDKEEKWLNKMSEKGYAMEDFFLGSYTFSQSEKNQYIYRIDLLNNWSGDKEDYASFMEETGAEFVCQWYRWVWFRKKSADGPFELYTDKESQTKQYIRIMRFFIIAFLLELVCGINILLNHQDAPVFTAIMSSLIFLIDAIFLSVIIKCMLKIRKLRF